MLACSGCGEGDPRLGAGARALSSGRRRAERSPRPSGRQDQDRRVADRDDRIVIAREDEDRRLDPGQEIREDDPLGKAPEVLRNTFTNSAWQDNLLNCADDDREQAAIVNAADLALLGRRCVIRRKAATDSEVIRPPIPTEVGHPFRSKPATLWRVVEALSCSATESPDQTLFAAMQGEVRCPPRERRCGRFAKS